jgi:hypothetical protein
MFERIEGGGWSDSSAGGRSRGCSFGRHRFLFSLFALLDRGDSRKRQGIKAHARFSLSKEKNSKKVMDRSKKGASESTKTFEENSSRTESETKMLFALPLCRA